jgi:methylmalonyl-CoA/ethylmalonyl-CoA epimerase
MSNAACFLPDDTVDAGTDPAVMDTMTQIDAAGLVRAQQRSFHHIGFVVPSIQPVATEFGKSFGFEWDDKIFHDTLQMVRVTFLRSQNPAEPLIELVESASSNSPVQRFLEQGGGLHHICYEVDSLDLQLKRSRAFRELVVRGPAPAIAFEQRRIAWVYTRNRLLVEYLEKVRDV